MSLLIPQLNSFPRWIFLTRDYNFFATAGTSLTRTIYTPVDGEVVLAVRLSIDAPFAGGGIATYTISIGQASTTDILGASDAFTPPVNLYGETPNVSAAFTSPNPVTATAISTGADLDQANSGRSKIWLLIGKLPLI